VNGLSVNVRALENEKVVLQSHLQQAGRKSAEHRRRILRLVIALVYQLQKTQTLEGEKKARDARIAALELAKADADEKYTNDLRDKQKEVDERTEREGLLDGELEEANQSIKDLVEERTKVRNSNTELLKEKGEAIKAKGEAEQLRRKAEEDLDAEKSKRIDRVTTLHGQVEQHKATIENLEQCNANLEAQATEHENSATELHSKLATVKSDLAAVEAQALA
jgi:chromosome segregation ATPase